MMCYWTIDKNTEELRHREQCSVYQVFIISLGCHLLWKKAINRAPTRLNNKTLPKMLPQWQTDRCRAVKEWSRPSKSALNLTLPNLQGSALTEPATIQPTPKILLCLKKNWPVLLFRYVRLLFRSNVDEEDWIWSSCTASASGASGAPAGGRKHQNFHASASRRNPSIQLTTSASFEITIKKGHL